MLSALALASSLWIASQEAGARPLDVVPASSGADSVDVALGDSEAFGQPLVRFTARPDLHHGIVGQFGLPDLLFSPISVVSASTLGLAISVVDRGGSDEEVPRIDAPPIRDVPNGVSLVAVVQDASPMVAGPRFQGPVVQDPRISVGQASVGVPERAIAIPIDTAGPQPTVIRPTFLYLRPEAFFEWNAGPGASARTVDIDPPGSVEGVSTGRAGLGERSHRLTDLSAILPKPSTDRVKVEDIANEFAEDFYWIVGSHAADLYATAWAIERCNGACGEGNPFGPSSEARIALKMAGTASTALTLWKLRRDGHGRTATVLRWATVIFNAGLVVNNTRHAIRRR